MEAYVVPAESRCPQSLSITMDLPHIYVHDEVIARRLAAPRCLEFNFFVTAVSSAFSTASSPSVKTSSMWHGLLMYGLILPWALYVRRRCFGAWLTWMCLTIRFSVLRPLASALASAFLRRPTRNSADLTGCLAFETPNCLPNNAGQHSPHHFRHISCE